MLAHRRFVVLAASIAVVLSGCGGGDDDTMPDATQMSDSDSSSSSDSTSLSEIISSSDSIRQTTVGQEAVARAAGNTPLAGSVTQSSDGGADNVTDDSVGVTVGVADGQLTYVVSYNGTEVASTAVGTEAADVQEARDRTEGTLLFERLPGQRGFRGIEFYRSLGAAEAESLGLPGAGDIWVDVYTDYEGSNDTDYLAGGIWVYAPDDTSSLEDYEYGAFVDGNDPFTQGNLAGLTGTATYSGPATGVYADVPENTNYFFEASATLTADFGDGSQLGTIEGSIHDARIDGLRVPTDPSLNLNSADIGSADSGFFTGTTSMSFDGDTYTGQWGGQFYGNGASSTDAPGSVAGTFGAATADENKSVLGVFGAYRQ